MNYANEVSIIIQYCLDKEKEKGQSKVMNYQCRPVRDGVELANKKEKY